MEDKENPGSSSDSAYNKLVCQEDVNVDEEPLYSKAERQQGTSEEQSTRVWKNRVKDCIDFYTILDM